MNSVLTPTDLINSDPYLANYTLPRLAFPERDDADLILEPLWHGLRAREYRRAVAYGRFALQDAPNAATPETHAAILAGVALAELRLGSMAVGRKLAERSLEQWPSQWFAHRVILEAYHVSKDYRAAIAYAESLPEVHAVAPWDEPLTRTSVTLAMASWAWRMSDWEAALQYLLMACPDGIEAFPAELLEDYFRLALYRNDAEAAAAAAAVLIRARSVESADVVLQMLVQQGWTEQALPLYRSAFSEAPQSPVLRRRLVALCLKEGNVDEARDLARPGALPVDISGHGRRTMRLTR